MTDKFILVGREPVAVDGTRLKGVNSTGRNVTGEKVQTLLKNADGRPTEHLAAVEGADRTRGTAAAVWKVCATAPREPRTDHRWPPDLIAP